MACRSAPRRCGRCSATKPWQKVLKDTWAKLEKGDYDWAHLAMQLLAERVREKCKTDKLAIAHDVEELLHKSWNPMRGKRATGDTKLEWQPKHRRGSARQATKGKVR